jgi:chorismate dehydratase
MSLLIGKIPFLNCEPFYPLLGEHRLAAMPPRDLGELAEREAIDAGIMATADYLRLEDRYEPIGNLGVANREEVRSILLFSRQPMDELGGKRVGVTEETSTSVRLLRLLLEVRDEVRPREYSRGLREKADAFLVIGDEALRRGQADCDGFVHRFDLATQWWAWKKRPFVFALWVVRKSLPEDTKREFADLLERSFQTGLRQIPETAARYAGELGTAHGLASYLHNFQYRLGPDEWQGLDEFRRLALDNDLLQPI